MTEFLRFIEIIRTMVRRELKVKYRGSILGYLWSMMNPLLFMITISVVFSFFVRGIPNYPLFVLAGIMYWNLTSNALTVGSQSMIMNAALMKKVNIPFWIFPVVPVLTFANHFIFACIPYFIIFLFIGPEEVPAVGWFPLVFLLFLAFLLGLSTALSVLNVFFRDVGHVIEPVLVMLMYATPIIYDRRDPRIPAYIQKILGFNPFTHFVEVGRKTIFGGESVTFMDIGMLMIIASTALTIGFFLYRKFKYKIIFHI